MIQRLLSSIALAGLLAAPVLAEPVTLGEAVARAVTYDPAITRAEAGLDQSRAGVDAARAQRGFQAGVQAEVGALETDFTSDTISQVPRSVGLQAEWTVYSSGALDAGVEASRHMQRAAELQLIGARERTVLDTFEAYAQTWLSERVVEVGVATVETFRIRLDETNARFNQGQVTRTDVALTEARLASAEAEQEAAMARLAATRARLSRLTGVAEASPQAPAALDAVLPVSAEMALQRVLDDNPDLAAARSAGLSAEQRLREARASFGPKVSLRARATHGEDMYFFFEDPISDVGAFVKLEIPLFTSGMRSASTRQALAGQRAADAGVRLAELQLEEAVNGLWGDIEARRLALNAAFRAETAAELAAEGAQREYEAGIRTLVDALDAENAFREAQIARYSAEVQLQIAQARLLSLSSDLEGSIPA